MTETILIIIISLFCIRYLTGCYRIIQSHNFHSRKVKEPTDKAVAFRPVIVVPALMEQSSLEESVAHFSKLAQVCTCEVVFVTSESETLLLEEGRLSTCELAEELRKRYVFVHLHYPHKSGTKADQLNFAVSSLHSNEICWIIYDIDSRPSPGSLNLFLETIRGQPAYNVFQQSSRFIPPRTNLSNSPYSDAMRRCAALRANRFVALYELPRIRRRLGGSIVAQSTYAHVTGHGLAIRSTYLRQFPFPENAIMEDMFYGFLLNSRAEAVIPVPSLDEAEVPDNTQLEFAQAVRWFVGPARGLLYFFHPDCRRSLPTFGVLMHSLYITCEWLFQACALPILVGAFLFGSQRTTAMLTAFIVSYSSTVLLTDYFVGSLGKTALERLLALLLYPVCLTLFGLAGWCGLCMLLTSPNALQYKTPHNQRKI